MKYSNFIAMLFSSFFILISSGCERTDQLKPVPDDGVLIDTRGDCDDCPGANECCCVIQFLDGDPGNFKICGTSDGDATACEVDPSPCANDINGLQHSSFTLSSIFPIHYFCVDENTAFQISRFASPSGTTNTRISCQRGQVNPQWVLESFINDDRSSYDCDDSCTLDGPCGS